MASTTTQTSIANMALQMAGYEPIASLNENSRGARAINRTYQQVLWHELRSNFWNFSIKRATLAAAAITPSFGKNNYYILPPDFLDLAMPDQITTYNYGQIPSVPNVPASQQDYQIEAYDNNTLAIASNLASPIYIRYVSNAINEALFDACFVTAFAAALALEVCEELTQSNSKLANIEKIYDDAIAMAKQRGSFESQPIVAPTDRYLTVRL